MKEYHCSVFNDYCSLGLSILIWYQDGNDRYVLRGNIFEKVLTEGEWIPPTLKLPGIPLDNDVATALVDGLLSAGVKPSIKLPDSNELTATKYHLEDMRKIVMTQIDKGEL